MSRFGTLVFGLALTATVGGATQAATLFEEKFPTRNRLQVTGFELLKPGEITIEAAGLGMPDADELVAYAWIIDQNSRKVVWEMKVDETDRSWGKKYLRKSSHDQVFSRGRYELYLYTGDDNGWYFDDGGKSVVRAFSNLLSGSSKSIKEQLADCFVRLESSDLGVAEFRTFDPDGEIPGALLRETKLGDDEYIQQAFALDRPSTLRVYALLEAPIGYDTPVDYGWIVNSDTHEIVWSAADDHSLRAGGGKKNRKIDTEISLPKGNYILYYVTDDSHSYDRFNTAPPYDPLNWGITLLPGSGFTPAAFQLANLPADPDPLIDMTEVGDDQLLKTRFKLSKETHLRVRAVGEWSSGDDEFVDFGWIEAVPSGDVVWEMTDRNTSYAGGSDKNRIFDGDIVLPAGDYVVMYQSDDSHSFDNWNSGHPYLQRAWGIAVYPGRGFDKSTFTTSGRMPTDSRRHSRRSRDGSDF